MTAICCIGLLDFKRGNASTDSMLVDCISVDLSCSTCTSKFAIYVARLMSYLCSKFLLLYINQNGP